MKAGGTPADRTRTEAEVFCRPVGDRRRAGGQGRVSMGDDAMDALNSRQIDGQAPAYFLAG